MKKYTANIVTGCRIFGSIFLLFFPICSVGFYIVYLFCGFSDMIDGSIARKTNSSSEFGAKLDTVADFLFTIVALIKFLPIIHLPTWLWMWISVIAIIKIWNIMWGLLYKKKLLLLHTVMNKVTGLFLFLLPFTLSYIELKDSAVVICAMATVSLLQEGYYGRKGRDIV